MATYDMNVITYIWYFSLLLDYIFVQIYIIFNFEKFIYTLIFIIAFYKVYKNAKQ